MEEFSYDVSIDDISEFISDNEFTIPEIKEEDITKNYRKDIRGILSKKETDTEKEQFIDESLEKINKKIWDNYIGIYHDINELNSEKRLKNFTNRLEKTSILKDVPFGVKNMRLFEYDHKVWEEFLLEIKKGYHLIGFNYPPYKKTLVEFYKLNQRAYVVRKAYLQRQVLREFTTEVNSGLSVIPEDYSAEWKQDKKQEKLKLLHLYREYMKNSDMKETIEKIFEHLKIKFNLMHLSDQEAAGKIHSITDINFYKKNEGLSYESASSIIRAYKRFEENKS